MACNVIKHKNGAVSQVFANNGKPSSLFNDLVQQLGNKESAHKVWLKTRTNTFKNKFEDVLDENGEPFIESLESILAAMPTVKETIPITPETDLDVQAVQNELDDRMNDFLQELGFTSKIVNNLTDRKGNALPGVAKVDTLLKTVQIVRGKADISTLPEEAAHVFVEILKEKDSPLYQSMLGMVKKYEMYKKVVDEYSSNPLYQNEDGSPDEGKLQDEAIGKLIAREVIKAHLPTEDKKNLSRFSRWFQKVLNAVKRFFGGENNPFLSAAESMLQESASMYKNSIDNLGDVEMLQLENEGKITDPQEDLKNNLLADHQNLTLKAWAEEDGALPKQLEAIKEMSDEGEVTGYRYMKDGKEVKIFNRVSHKSTRAFIKSMGLERAKEITNMAKNKHIRNNGTRIHTAAQHLMDYYGRKSDYIDVIDPNGVGKLSLDFIRNEAKMNRVHFDILKKGVQNHIKQIEFAQQEISKTRKAMLFTELKIVDVTKKVAGLQGVAGTMDVSVVYSDASMDILDWKTLVPSRQFTNKKGKIDKNPFRTKMDNYNSQIGTYKEMLSNIHKVKKFNRTRIIPIAVAYGKNSNGEFTDIITKLDMAHTNPEFLRSIAVALERTNHKEVDRLIEDLDKQIQKIKLEKRNIKGKRADFAKLNARLEILEDSMQDLVVKQDLKELITNVANRIEVISAGIGINDPKHPKYLDDNDLKAFYEDFIVFKDIAESTLKYMDENIKKFPVKDRSAYRNAFVKNAAIVNNNIERIKSEWLDRIVEGGEKELGIDLTEMPKQSGYFSKEFTTMDVFPHPAFRAAYKKIYRSFNKTKRITDAINEEIQQMTFGKADDNGKRNGGLSRFAKNQGLSLQQVYTKYLIKDTKSEEGKTIYRNLVPEYSNEFIKEIKKYQEKGNETWMKNNFKIKKGARAKFNEMREAALEREKFLFPDLTKYDNNGKLEVIPSENKAIREANMKRWDQKYNVFEEIYGDAWLNSYWSMFLEPKSPADHYSPEYKVINQEGNEALLNYYTKYKEITERLGNDANINLNSNFIANVKDDLVESLLNHGFGFKGMNEMADAISRSFTVRDSMEDMGVLSEDRSFVNQIPLPYINDLTNSHGNIDASVKSVDLSKSLYLLSTGVYNHKHMGEIESYIMGLKQLIISKGEARSVDGVLQYQGGRPSRVDASPELLATYDKFIKRYLYGQRLQSEDSTFGRLSKIKTIKSLQSIYSAKVLGMAIIPGMAARITGGVNMLLNGIEGVHYTNKHLNISRRAYISNNKQWNALVNFIDPFQSGLTWRKAKDLSMKAANKVLDLDNWYAPLRNPDENIDGMITVAMAQNHGVDKDGILQRLEDLPEGTQPLWVGFLESHKKGELMIPNLTQEAYEDFRLRVKAVARKIKGEMSEENIIAFSTSLTGQLLLQFKGWMPGLVTSRFGDQRYNDVLKVLEEGRYWGFLKGVGTGSHGKTLLNEERKIMSVLHSGLSNLKDGLAQLMFLEKFITNPAEKARLEKEGKWTDAKERKYKNRVAALEREFAVFKRNSTDPRIKNMKSSREFLKMRQRSVRRTVAEIQALLGLYLAGMAMGMGVGPDDEKWKNKAWINRKIYMLLARTQMELGFTLNPKEFANFTKGLVPLVGLLTDSMKVLENGWTETLEALELIPENTRDKTPMFYHTLKFVPGWSQLRRIFEVYEQDKNNPYVSR